MNSALSDYDETVHGDKEKGFFSRIFQCCETKNETSQGEGSQIGMSFRMSVAMKQSSSGMGEEKESYTHMFNYIDADNQYEITRSQVSRSICVHTLVQCNHFQHII